MADTAAMYVAGLRQDVTEAWGEECPCSVINALVVQACLGGEILSYDLGLRGSHYMNHVITDGQEFYIDLCSEPCFDSHHAGAKVCDRQALVANDDTFKRFSLFSGRLLLSWGGLNA